MHPFAVSSFLTGGSSNHFYDGLCDGGGPPPVPDSWDGRLTSQKPVEARGLYEKVEGVLERHSGESAASTKSVDGREAANNASTSLRESTAGSLSTTHVE
jgi:hypothetical protein